MIEFFILHPYLSLFAIGGMGSFVINAVYDDRKEKREHALAMAQASTQAEVAKALAAAPDHERQKLAQELLEAHDDVEESLK
jgi:Na+-transporting methylmalonyl-CoA/oxaloacetate decarboxylase gamma subunit